MLLFARAAPGSVETGAPFPDLAESPKEMLAAGSHKPKLAEDEPDAKAILPEPHSVKKQMSNGG